MRRLGFLLVCILALAGLSSPSYAARGHQLPHHDGPTFLNFGPHRTDAVAVARGTTAVPGIDVSDDTTPLCASTYEGSTRPLPTKLCVWYATSGPNAASDSYAATVRDTLQHVESTYLAAGYLPVEPSQDPQPGYGGSMNVYLHDLGSSSLYGFTAPDSGRGQVSPSGYDRAAYMVIDRGYPASHYPDASGFPGCASACSTSLMRITVAHEFFHATQFAYNAIKSDRWFMEATATWAETQIYPTLHDNWLYLSTSAPAGSPRPDGVLSQPWEALDDNTGGPTGQAFYQDFAWIQYLGDAFPTKVGSMPAVILNAWRFTSARQGLPTYFSVTAINRAITQAGGSLPSAWFAFSAGNRHHILGAGYPQSRAIWGRTVTPSNLAPTTVRGAVNHLSSQTFVLAPQRLASTEHIHLAISVANQTGTVAGVTVYLRNGAIRTYRMTFVRGVAAQNFSFDNASVLRIELTIGNAASSYTNCWSGTTVYACEGGLPSVGRVGFTWTGRFYHL